MSESQNMLVADTKGNEGGTMAKIITTGDNLKAIERCDRCGGQAYVKAFLHSGSEMLFCAHHAREHMEKLREVCESIVDHTGRLQAQEAQPRDAGSTL